MIETTERDSQACEPLTTEAAGERLDTMSSSPYATYKYVFDLVLTLVIGFFVWPLALAAMLAIKLTSRGPMIYQQVRVGLNGRHFTIYKIRTMHDNCEGTTGPQWSSLNGDPRITKVGSFLRKTHLDELPQLWNVLRGEMSLIGPRPERPKFVKWLTTAIPEYQDRHQVLPGVTGLRKSSSPRIAKKRAWRESNSRSPATSATCAGWGWGSTSGSFSGPASRSSASPLKSRAGCCGCRASTTRRPPDVPS